MRRHPFSAMAMALFLAAPLGSLAVHDIAAAAEPSSQAPKEAREINVAGDILFRGPTSVAVGLEDVNHEIYGGIYSQMVFGEAFAEPERTPGISGMWRATGQGINYSLIDAEPFKGKQSQQIGRVQAGEWGGVENRGLNRQGMAFVSGKPYEGTVVLRSSGRLPVRISLQSADGKSIYAQQIIQPEPGGWAAYPVTLTPSQSDDHGRLAVEIEAAGTLDIGYVLLQRGAWGRYKDLPVRADVARAMADQGLQAIRFGGCANGGCGDVSDYKWKSMVGDPVHRPVTRGFWYPHESNGFGIFEFLQLGEALGIEAVPSLNIEESATDIRDLMDYLYGPASTKWGAQRIADGHPEPYRVRRIQLGNEEAVDDAYFEKFRALAEVIWDYDPRIRLVVGDFTYEHEIKDPFNFTGGGKVKTLAAHKKLLEFAARRGQELDFDVHLWTRNIRDGGWNTKDGTLKAQIAALDSYAAALRAIGPKDSRFKIVVFELNANSHDLNRALANAYAISALQKRAYIDVISSANGLQVDGHNDNGWNQGLIFMNQSNVWAQPPYYVHQMIAASQRISVIRTHVTGAGDQVEATAFRDLGGISLNIVNASSETATYAINFGRGVANSDVRIMTLGGVRGTAVNTSMNPTNIVPEASGLKLDEAGRTSYTLPPLSFTTMQIQN